MRKRGSKPLKLILSRETLAKLRGGEGEEGGEAGFACTTFTTSKGDTGGGTGPSFVTCPGQPGCFSNPVILSNCGRC